MSSSTNQWKIVVGAFEGQTLGLERGVDSAVLTLPDGSVRELKLDPKTYNFQDDTCCLSFWRSPQLGQPSIFLVQDLGPAGDAAGQAGTWGSQLGTSVYQMLGARLEGKGPLAPIIGDRGQTASPWLGVSWYVMFKKGGQPIPPTGSGIVYVQMANLRFGIYWSEGRGKQPKLYDELGFTAGNFTLDSKVRSIAYWRRPSKAPNVIFAMYDGGDQRSLLPCEAGDPGDEPVGVWGAEEG
jgi:hypothetical protein